ncbi:MAG: HU family DNA-binding protein [Gemmatimonadetes bacterium]|nr:MAG: HU family DNA-binding protein [Gemmatimonadota bacterium]
MKKQDFVSKVAEQTGLTKKQSEAAVNAVLDTIKDALSQGEKVSFVGFGTFMVVERSARKGKNPRTGDTIEIPAKKVPVFRAGKALKDSAA